MATANAAVVRPRTPLSMVAMAGLATATTLAQGQATIEWAIPVDGDFRAAGNWTPMIVPGAMDTAVLGGAGAYTVRVVTNRTVGFFELANPAASVAVQAGRTLTIGGASGGGGFLVNDGGVSSQATLFLADGADVTGDVTLNAPIGTTLWARLGHSGTGPAATMRGVIAGRGQVFGTVNEVGGVDATGDGDWVEFNGSTAAMAAGAVVRSDAGGAVGLDSSTVTGGTWSGGGGALLRSAGVSTIDGATFTGQWRLEQGDTLALAGVGAGDGEIVVNDAGVTTQATLQLADSADVTVDVTLNAPEGTTLWARLLHGDTGPAATMRGVIAGRGQVLGALNEVGGVDSTGDGDWVEFNSSTVAMAPVAVVRSDAGGAVGVVSSTVTGGTWSGGDGALLRSAGTSTIDGATFTGQWRLEQGDTLALAGVGAGDGEIVVNDAGVTTQATLQLADGADVTVDVTLNAPEGTTLWARLLHGDTGPAAIMRGVIAGRGQVLGTMNEVGGVDTTTEGDWIEFTSATVAMAGGAVVRSDVGGAVGLDSSTVTGGTWNGGGGALLRGGGTSTIDGATFTGQWRLEQGDTLALAGVGAGDGEIVVNDGGVSSQATLQLADGADVTVDVTLNAPEGTTLWARLLHGDTGPAATVRGVIAGRGQVSGTIVLDGVLAPGSGPEGTGVLEASGVALSMTPTARVEIDAAGASPTQHDRIDGSGSITLDGGLDVDFVGGYVPEPRDQFEIIRATAVDGAFADIDIEPVGAIGPAHIVYTGTSVIVVICAADRDADGELTIFDFLAFQNLFDAGDLRADLDEDGQLTIFDFLVFQNRFDAGCG